MNKYQSVAPPVQIPTPPSYAEKSFLHTTGAAVVVPFWQSVIISLAVGFLSLIVQVRFGLYLTDAAINSVVVVVIVFLAVFVFLLRHWFALTIEKALNIDIPGMGDDVLEKPKTTEVWVKKVDNGTYSANLRTFHVSEEKLLNFAQAMTQGRPISRRYWMQHGFSDGEYRQFQSDNIRMGYWEAAGAGSNAGFVLTPEGEEFYYGYAGADSPTPQEDMSGE